MRLDTDSADLRQRLAQVEAENEALRRQLADARRELQGVIAHRDELRGFATE